MFTGLIEEMGSVRSVQRKSRSLHLTVAAAKVLDDLKIGDSIAVNGCCLTVVTLHNGSFTADVMPETYQRTNLGRLSPGHAVNLERCLTMGTRLGGHLVSGHIDGLGEIKSLQPEEIAVLYTIKAPREVLRYTVPKGSIAVDGISLTVVDVSADTFSVSIIPHTLAVTTLGRRNPGDGVNLEADLIGKYVERFVSARQGSANGDQGLSKRMLEENGFV